MSKTVLKPCPFCGGDAEIGENWDGFFVRCSKCRFSTPSYRPKKKGMAVNEWNQRVREVAS